ncbi:redoxin domain-containing protein [Sphingopyxis sp. KK2]|uniref:redoxin domain-containing protein n=1 Tax=Sphingopyxis sp. KK2 TaxID=1855727 RepID=UPI00097E6EE3|nr:redoxin domain-containing protein [Sphingopyxis sp. KK2]
MFKELTPAPEWDVDQWFNSSAPISIASLRGKVIVAGAFQMLCPGCVSHLIPQLKSVRALFPEDKVAVIGLHTVFEHHEAMGPASLKAFLHEYRVPFPVGVDKPSGSSDPSPLTMRRYRMRGTPTLLLIDADGNLRSQTFGHVPDLQLGAEISFLLQERDILARADNGEGAAQNAGCDDSACAVN